LRSQPAANNSKNHSTSNEIHKIQEMTKILDDQSRQLSFKDVVIQTLELKLEHLSESNTALNCKIIELQDENSRKQTVEADLFLQEQEELTSVLSNLRHQLELSQV